MTADHVAALAEVLADSIGAELYESLMEASADEWRRWEFMTDAAKEKYCAEGARIVGATIAPAMRDLLAEAWDEGVTCAGRYGHEDTWDWPDDTPHRWNPYREEQR